jgi:K+-transporting ATPase ATPase C chain
MRAVLLKLLGMLIYCGLDPHINAATAYFQIERVAKSRGIESKDIKNLVDNMIIKRSIGFLEEACVNFLMLNKA